VGHFSVSRPFCGGVRVCVGLRIPAYSEMGRCGALFGVGAMLAWSRVGMVFALLLGGMTARMVKLFGDIVAMENENGKLVVMKGEKRLSPYEYVMTRCLTPNCCALFRLGANKYDLVFSSGVIMYGCHFAYKLRKLDSSEGKSLIGAGILHGTHVLDDLGNYLAFIPRLYDIAIAEDKFLIGFVLLGPEPYVRVYSLCGAFLADGILSEALEKARQKVDSLYDRYDVCNVSR
jgi:hypothetical protein